MGGILQGCPGASFFKTPTITEKICPVCGCVIELFSIDVSVACDNCGFVAYNDLQTCIKWCKHAEECIGTELYEKLMSENIGDADDDNEKEDDQV